MNGTPASGSFLNLDVIPFNSKVSREVITGIYNPGLNHHLFDRCVELLNNPFGLLNIGSDVGDDDRIRPRIDADFASPAFSLLAQMSIET